MAGVESIKSLLAMSFAIHSAYDLAKADGKIDVSDIQHTVTLFGKIYSAIKDIGGVLPELKDLSDAEKSELMQWAKESYDIKDDELESKVEDALAVALSLAKFVLGFVK